MWKAKSDRPGGRPSHLKEEDSGRLKLVRSSSVPLNHGRDTKLGTGSGGSGPMAVAMPEELDVTGDTFDKIVLRCETALGKMGAVTSAVKLHKPEVDLLENLEIARNFMYTVLKHATRGRSLLQDIFGVDDGARVSRVYHILDTAHLTVYKDDQRLRGAREACDSVMRVLADRGVSSQMTERIHSEKPELGHGNLVRSHPPGINITDGAIPGEATWSFTEELSMSNRSETLLPSRIDPLSVELHGSHDLGVPLKFAVCSPQHTAIMPDPQSDHSLSPSPKLAEEPESTWREDVPATPTTSPDLVDGPNSEPEGSWEEDVPATPVPNHDLVEVPPNTEPEGSWEGNVAARPVPNHDLVEGSANTEPEGSWEGNVAARSTPSPDLDQLPSNTEPEGSCDEDVSATPVPNHDLGEGPPNTEPEGSWEGAVAATPKADLDLVERQSNAELEGPWEEDASVETPDVQKSTCEQDSPAEVASTAQLLTPRCENSVAEAVHVDPLPSDSLLDDEVLVSAHDDSPREGQPEDSNGESSFLTGSAKPTESDDALTTPQSKRQSVPTDLEQSVPVEMVAAAWATGDLKLGAGHADTLQSPKKSAHPKRVSRPVATQAKPVDSTAHRSRLPIQPRRLGRSMSADVSGLSATRRLSPSVSGNLGTPSLSPRRTKRASAAESFVSTGSVSPRTNQECTTRSTFPRKVADTRKHSRPQRINSTPAEQMRTMRALVGTRSPGRSASPVGDGHPTGSFGASLGTLSDGRLTVGSAAGCGASPRSPRNGMAAFESGPSLRASLRSARISLRPKASSLSAQSGGRHSLVVSGQSRTAELSLARSSRELLPSAYARLNSPSRPPVSSCKSRSLDRSVSPTGDDGVATWRRTVASPVASYRDGLSENVSGQKTPSSCPDQEHDGRHVVETVVEPVVESCRELVSDATGGNGREDAAAHLQKVKTSKPCTWGSTRSPGASYSSCSRDGLTGSLAQRSIAVLLGSAASRCTVPSSQLCTEEHLARNGCAPLESATSPGASPRIPLRQTAAPGSRLSLGAFGRSHFAALSPTHSAGSRTTLASPGVAVEESVAAVSFKVRALRPSAPGGLPMSRSPSLPSQLTFAASITAPNLATYRGSLGCPGRHAVVQRPPPSNGGVACV